MQRRLDRIPEIPQEGRTPSDSPQRPQSHNDELRRMFSRQRAEQPARSQSDGQSLGQEVDKEQEKLNKILDKIVNKHKVNENLYNQEEIRKEILEMVKRKIEKEQGNKWDKAQTLVARITCYESPHNGLYTAIAEDARNLMNLEEGIRYQHGVKEYSEVKQVTNEIRQYLKNWLMSHPEINQERQNAIRQFNDENWQRELEAMQQLPVDNQPTLQQLPVDNQPTLQDITNILRELHITNIMQELHIDSIPQETLRNNIPQETLRNNIPQETYINNNLQQERRNNTPQEIHNEIYHIQRQIIEQRPEQQQTPRQRFSQNILRRLSFDPSQLEQRLNPQWREQQSREQQRRERQRYDQIYREQQRRGRQRYDQIYRELQRHNQQLRELQRCGPASAIAEPITRALNILRN